MADLKTTQLTQLSATPATGDLLAIVDVSDTTMSAGGTNKKITANRFAWTNGTAATITGGGTVALGGNALTVSDSGTLALGGNTLTVPASGTVALLGAINTFTAGQIIDSSASNILSLANGGSNIMLFQQASGNGNTILMTANDAGANRGNRIWIQRNNNASTPAAGHVLLEDKGGAAYRIWPDDSGVVRINGADPTTANDTAGTVVGSQSSSLDTKDVDAELPDVNASIAHIVAAVESGALRAWRYKSGAYNGEHFPIGIVTDYAPRYGMDRDAAHPAGKSLNVPVAIGDLMAAVTWLHRRVLELEQIAKDCKQNHD